ncbi:hypothetical protein [Amycolatopsis methanolica]|uniref:Oxidoreductase n=1 Tax=Amycolatopsis methanolica 239 TaxID=1068978 RepID=A0A076N5P7_AMYME|nr:hypothetical protein [Amycolatopsis methanolica]AIJ26611.1 oxidoreductase [Amycolatopsis methanolica 239]
MFQNFGLIPSVRGGAVLVPAATRTRREFLDFVIDGRPVSSLFDGQDVVSALATDLPPRALSREVDRLLLRGPSSLPDGRQVLYCCPECGDLACGAITAMITRHDDLIIWRDFRRQDSQDRELESYPDAGPFRFSADQYRNALEQVRSTQNW